MKKGGGGAPTGKVADAINKSFGSYDNFRKEFTVAANTAFGSGWAWLVSDGNGLKVVKTIGADLPITDGLVSTWLTMEYIICGLELTVCGCWCLLLFYRCFSHDTDPVTTRNPSSSSSKYQHGHITMITTIGPQY